MKKQKNKNAGIAALVTGLLGLTLWLISIPSAGGVILRLILSLLGIAFGHKHRNALETAGLVLGILGIIVFLINLYLFFIIGLVAIGIGLAPPAID